MIMISITLQLDWKPNAQFAGILWAHHHGWYARAGIDLTIVPWWPGFNQMDALESDANVIVSTEDKVRHCITRNNLFIGTGANYAFEMGAPIAACDFDYDGFGGGPWKLFLKWNGVRYATFAEMREKAPVYRHATLVDAAGAFAAGTLPPADEKIAQAVADLRLKAGGAAIDAG